MNQTTEGNDLKRIIDFVSDEIGRYADYQKHKESVAYTGLALFTGATGLVLTSKDWPPSVWNSNVCVLSIITLTAFWFAVLFFLRFQLQRRRWAALRVAGCERVLVRWATNKIDTERLSADKRPQLDENEKISTLLRIIDWVWPQKYSVLAIEEPKESDKPYYPGVLIDAWREAEESGTAALRHERLIILSGWALYACMLYRTLFL